LADVEVANKVAESTPPPISDKAVIELRIKGFTHEEIGQHFGVSRQAITKRLKGIFKLIDGGKLEAYRQHRVSILEGLEIEVLSELSNPDKLEKASANNLAYAFGQLHSARRLEEGQSTENIGLAAIVMRVEASLKKDNAGVVNE
jgi:hypothetical protein